MTVVHKELRGAQEIITNKDGKLSLDKEILSQILLQENIKDKPVCVVSIAGIYRGGKSFLLNFLLRYLRIKYKGKVNVDDSNWLTEKEGPLKGFRWRHGSKRHTTGILMWPEVFLAKLPTNEEIAIVLLDTQGSFDNKTTMKDNAVIFALSTLISSIQIYNLRDNIKNYDLDHLQYFSGYGKLAKEQTSQNDKTSSQKPFQRLMFLIRDWSCAYEYKYGSSGGKNYVKDYLNVTTDQPDDLIKQKQNLEELFQEIEGFLMPYPGKSVATSEYFVGKLEDIDDDFKQLAQEFAVKILSTNNLKPKIINGHKIKTQDLFNHICSYWENFQRDDLPPLQSLFDSSVAVQNKDALDSALKEYDNKMKEMTTYVLEDEQLNDIHEQCKQLALDIFRSAIKMGSESIQCEYRKQLIEKMEDKFKEIMHINDIKKNNLFLMKLALGINIFLKKSLGRIVTVGGILGGSAGGIAAIAIPTVQTTFASIALATTGAVSGAIAAPVFVGFALKGFYKLVVTQKQKFLERRREMGAE